MSVRPFALLAGAVFSSLAIVVAQDGGWIQNFADAKQKAKADKKDLLVDFTGSDWCVWCKRLDKEVFAETSFQTEIAKSYILVKLDFPSDQALVTDEIRAQNEQLQKDFAIGGFPAILLIDADGRPYAQTGYQQGGAAKYLEHVAELQKAKAKRDENFAKAKDAKGLDRARHLAAGVDAMAEELAMKHYNTEIQEIIALDAKNEAGLLDRYAARIARTELETKFNELAQEGKWDEVTTLVDETLKKNKGRKTVEQTATFFKAIVAIESKHDFDAALKLIDAAKAFDPESEMGKRLDQIRKNVEQLKEQKDKEGKEKGDGGK